MLAAITPAGADSGTVLSTLFGVKCFARMAGADPQSIDEEEPGIAARLMIASLASLLEDPILYEALCGLERPSDLDGVRDIAIALYSKSRSRKRATPSADSTRDRGGYAASGGGSRGLALPGSDSEEEEASEDAAAEHAEARGSGMAGRLVAGIQVRRRVDNEGAGGDRRCQEGAAEARSGLGGGGKRGWVS